MADNNALAPAPKRPRFSAARLAGDALEAAVAQRPVTEPEDGRWAAPPCLQCIVDGGMRAPGCQCDRTSIAGLAPVSLGAR